MLTYKKAEISDLKPVTDLAVLLYTDHPYEEIYGESAVLLKKDNESVWLCYDGDISVAFAQASLRYDYVEGTGGGQVGYLEGIYVRPEYRRQGIARTLVSICENWAREKGCGEFASDCEFDNTESYRFHLKIGFAEAGRIICFAKKL